MSDRKALTREESLCLSAARTRIALAPGEDPRAVAAAILTADGAMHLALNLDHSQDWGEICAETGAVSEAILRDNGARVVFSVAVNRRGMVLTPSDACLELLGEYGRHARIGVPDPDRPQGAAALQLLTLVGRRADQERTLGVILAGGLARRMGGGDKSRHRIAGRPMLNHVIERLTPQVAKVALNANGDPARFVDLALPVLPDSVPDYPGPLAGILAGLDWAAAQGARAIVTVAADTPFFPNDLVAGLTATVGPSGLCLAASLDPQGRVQPHPTFGLWPVELRDDLRRELDGGLRKVMLWTERHNAGRALFDSVPYDPFFNINTPDDLCRAEVLVGAWH